MRIDIATLFTQMCDSVLNESIVGRGIRNGFIEVYTHDIRKYTENKHRRVDDKPYGGGTGMLMQAQPVYDCISAIKSQGEGKPAIPSSAIFISVRPASSSSCLSSREDIPISHVPSVADVIPAPEPVC